MGLSHNNTLAKLAPNWASIDKTQLPRVAFADHGEPDKPSSWKYPHHHVTNGTVGENGVFVSGTLYLHKGGLAAGWAAVNGARSGESGTLHDKAHLRAHRRAIGVEQMGSKSNYRKSLGTLSDALDLHETGVALDLAVAAYQLQIALGMKPVVKPKTVRRSASNLSQDQLDDLQEPGSALVSIDPDQLADASDKATPVAADSDHSPQPPIRMNPGTPIRVNPDNAARMQLVNIGPELPFPIDRENAQQMNKSVLYAIIQDTRELIALGIRV